MSRATTTSSRSWRLPDATRRYGDCRPRGFTLPECLVATSMVAISVAALAGTLDAVYANERYVQHEAKALQDAQQLLEEVVALPVVPAAGEIGMASMNNASDTVVLNQITPNGVIANTGTTIAPTSLVSNSAINEGQIDVSTPSRSNVSSASTGTRTVRVSSGAITIAGQSINSPNLRVVEVQITLPNGKTVKVKRLASSAEQKG